MSQRQADTLSPRVSNDDTLGLDIIDRSAGPKLVPGELRSPRGRKSKEEDIRRFSSPPVSPSTCHSRHSSVVTGSQPGAVTVKLTFQGIAKYELIGIKSILECLPWLPAESTVDADFSRSCRPFGA